jgi:Fic-DOC domain mobile mystery protein B
VTDEPTSIERFSLRNIGPEPTGATPLDEGDLEGLIPDFVATRADLNRAEFDNIAVTLPWSIERARTVGPSGVLEYDFLMTLHRKMFGDVWQWAGTHRLRMTNIGSSPEHLISETRLALDDMKYWHEHGTFGDDERAVRLHVRVVTIHPFPNGNGRCTRLLADLYLVALDLPIFTWGSKTLDVDGVTRKRYIDALLKARDDGEFADLVLFARS